jgi:hypothetical protein
MHLGRAALVLAACSAFCACSAVSGLSGFVFDGSGGGAGNGGGVSSSHGGVGGTGVAGGGGGQGQGGALSTTSTAVGSSVTSTGSSSSAVSSAMSSSSAGGGPCSGVDPGVCCPSATCALLCCHENQNTICESDCHNSKRIQCDSSTDCPGGQICCGYYNGSDYSQGIKCSVTCPKPVSLGMPGDYEICSLTQPMCLTGGTCQATTAIPGGDYGFCF